MRPGYLIKVILNETNTLQYFLRQVLHAKLRKQMKDSLYQFLCRILPLLTLLLILVCMYVMSPVLHTAVYRASLGNHPFVWLLLLAVAVGTFTLYIKK